VFDEQSRSNQQQVGWSRVLIQIGIITGSTRPGRLNEAVAGWILDLNSTRDDAEFQLVDIACFNLPLLDESAPPSLAQYSKRHTQAWATKIGTLDGFVFVTPEYNHSTSGALKNAIDFLYSEWNSKAAAFVRYGSVGDVRAVEHLRGVMAELQIADVRGQIALSLFDDFENFTKFTPRELHTPSLHALLDQLVGWTGALKAFRDYLTTRQTDESLRSRDVAPAGIIAPEPEGVRQ